jgi:DNA ligase (NAD+)
MNINTLGERTIDALFTNGLVKNIGDLYKLTPNDIKQLEGFKDQSTQKLLEGIEESKGAEFENVLFGLGIRYVGRTVAEKLARHYKNIDNLIKAPYEDLLNVQEIGEKIAESVVLYFNNDEHIVLINTLKEAGLRFSITESISEDNSPCLLSEKSFIISGVFQKYSREELKSIIKQHEGKVVSSISGKLDYVLAGENMGPSKRKKADDLGIQIISESDFEQMINKQ